MRQASGGVGSTTGQPQSSSRGGGGEKSGQTTMGFACCASNPRPGRLPLPHTCWRAKITRPPGIATALPCCRVRPLTLTARQFDGGGDRGGSVFLFIFRATSFGDGPGRCISSPPPGSIYVQRCIARQERCVCSPVMRAGVPSSAAWTVVLPRLNSTLVATVLFCKARRGAAQQVAQLLARCGTHSLKTHLGATLRQHSK